MSSKTRTVGSPGKPASTGHNAIAESSNPEQSPEDVAAYMADMLLELKQMAENSGHVTLSKVLEIAHREANWRKASRG